MATETTDGVKRNGGAMNVDQFAALARVLGAMTHSPLGNYIIPGLTSSLVGGPDRGTVRVFECSRDHEENVVPHSHRFDFGCFVVRGCVRNRLWRRAAPGYGDTYRTSTLTYSGAPGKAWALGNGHPVVLLEGRTGGYCLSRVRLAKSENEGTAA